MTRPQWGAALLVGACLTLAWLLTCPKYTINGNGALSTWSAFHWPSNEGNHATRFEHMDAALFFGGPVVIWAAVVGIALLKPHIRAWWHGL